MSKIERTRQLMDAHVGDALVEGYERHLSAISLPDPDDAHVLAAAIHARASVIVTFNLKDFPSEETQKFGVEAQHPDEFVRDLLDLSAPSVLDAMRDMRASLKNPPLSPSELVDRFSALGLVETARFLKPYCNGI
jgi:hypothetical protein